MLSTDPFKKVQTYWSTLHSSRYAVQYVRAAENHIRSTYEERDKIVAGAKGHYGRKSGGLTYYPAKKGETYDMNERSRHEDDDSSSGEK
jgi:hypothetical protein